MSGAPIPPTLLAVIASGASAPYVTEPIPQNPTGTNAVSILQGFPPITMATQAAGGQPPLGPDINGFLFLLSSHTLYVECGQAYPFNASLATAIGGYIVGTILGMTDGTGLWLNTVNGNTSNPDTGGAGWVPITTYGVGTQTGLTGGAVTLPVGVTKKPVIVLQGVLSSNLTIKLPAGVTQEWLLVNQTTGAFTTTVVTTAVGSVGLQVPQGGFSSPLGVYTNGSDGNVYPTVAPLAVPISQNATPLTLAERTSAGYLLATYFSQSSGVENPTIASVYVDNGDGFHRKISLTNFEAQLLLQGMGGQLVNGQVPLSVVSQWAASLFANAALTGTPTAPTAGAGTTTTQIATTAFANPGVTTNANGTAIRLPSGHIIQMGFASGGQNLNITFPVQFQTQLIAAFCCTSPRNFMGGQGTNFVSPHPTLPATQGMQITVDPSPGSGYWLAIGI